MTGIFESRLNLRVFQPQQKGINDQLGQLGRQELIALLGVSCDAVERIQRLDFCLSVLLISTPAISISTPGHLALCGPPGWSF